MTYYASDPAGERAVIRRTLDTYEKVVGRPDKAWLSSAMRGTLHTPVFLKEFGLVAYAIISMTISPTRSTPTGQIVCVPYSNDVNDFNMFARGGLSTRYLLKLCFDQTPKAKEIGRIMNVGLHPHVIGQPYRISAPRGNRLRQGQAAHLAADPGGKFAVRFDSEDARSGMQLRALHYKVGEIRRCQPRVPAPAARMATPEPRGAVSFARVPWRDPVAGRG